MRIGKWVFLALAGLAAGRAYADSDGYFCVGPTYLALESRSFDGDGVHRLHTFSLDDASGIGARVSLELPEFQVHGMSCEATVVTLISWDAAYVVAVSPELRLLERVVPNNLAELKSKHVARPISSAQSGPLPIDTHQVRFELEVSTSRQHHPGIVETTTVAKIVKLSKTGKFVTSRVIYAAASFETID